MILALPVMYFITSASLVYTIHGQDCSVASNVICAYKNNFDCLNSKSFHGPETSWMPAHQEYARMSVLLKYKSGIYGYESRNISGIILPILVIFSH